MTAHPSGIRIASCTLAGILLFIPGMTHGQSIQGLAQRPLESATLQGSVRDPRGRPVVAATVRLQAKDGTQTLTTQTDSGGSYRFSGLRDGSYVLAAEMTGYGKTTFDPCVIGPKEVKTADLTLQLSKTLPQGASTGTAGTGTPEFFDEPAFTVAGVTDSTNLGGHGSNTTVRTKEALAKDIVSLGAESGDKKSPGAAKSVPASAAAEASLRAAVERQPESFEASHRLGKLLVDSGKAREAIPYLERAGHLQPDDYENTYVLARAYAGAGKYELARTTARSLLTVKGNTGQEPAPRGQAGLHHLLGDVEEKLGNPLEAVREYQRAAELDPSEANLFDWGAELLMHRAVEPAIEVFSKGNRLFPGSARMLVGLGVAWYSHGSYDQAAQRLGEASDLNPDDPNPYLFLGKIDSVEATRSEGMVEKLGRFVRLQPENALANYYYAVSLWKRRNGPEDSQTAAQVESLLEKAVHLDPALGVGYLQLGILYSERRDFPGAISAYQRAIAASPQAEEAHYRLAQAYKRTGEKLKAQQELQLYGQISKKKEEEVERERREIRQFVYTLRDADTSLR